MVALNLRSPLPKSRGFTIVELLIVIVVIGILAAITIVAYNGFQQRARNAQVVAGVNMYVKAFLNYVTTTGAYPVNSGCLGANYPSNQCWQGIDGAFSVDGTLDANMATVLNSKPTLATSLMSIGIANDFRAGALYRTGPSKIIYYLAGTGQDCSIGGATGITEGGVVTQCSLLLP
jgi:prepilin-type N-terminal cleavage/methylation domain-containing protein